MNKARFKRRAKKVGLFLLALVTYPILAILALNPFAIPFLVAYTVFLGIYFFAPRDPNWSNH